MNKKIAILGASGCLGKQICKTLSIDSYKLKKISREDFNYVYDYKKLINIIIKFKPKIIINCAAVVKINKCKKNPKQAYEVNADLPYKLSVISQKVGAILIHFSTDAVFDGNKKTTYTAKDVPHPDTVYGKSKLLGEKNISYYKKLLIIRLSLLYGKYHQNQLVGRLLKKLKKNKKVFVSKDVYTTPTNSEDVAIFIKKNIGNKKIHKLIKKKILHLSGDKRFSTFVFIKKISNIIGKSQNVIGVKESFFNRKSTKSKNFGLKTNVKNFISSDLNKFIYDIGYYDK